MNLNIINLEPSQWSREDWQDAYAGYCEHNMYGPKTKREYYDMVIANFAKITPQPLSDELKRKWTIGKRNARLWAKKHGCDMNGRLLSVVELEKRNADALAVAERAESVAIDTMQRLDHIIDNIKRRRIT